MNNNPVVIRAAIIEDEIPAARLLNHMLAELRPEWEMLRSGLVKIRILTFSFWISN